MTPAARADSPKLDGELVRLLTEFGGSVDDHTIRSVFEASLAPFRGARIQLFVPILSYRHAREELRLRLRAGDGQSFH